MRIGRWSELSVNSVCQAHEVMKDADANETSGELGSAFGGTLVELIESPIFLLLVSVDLEYHDGWCALKSLKIRGVCCGTRSGFTVTHIGRCWLWGIGSRIDFLHMFLMFMEAKMRSGLYLLFCR